MLILDELLLSLSDEHVSKVNIQLIDEFNFNQKDFCFIIDNGSVLSYGKRKFTQLLKSGDPISFAETILGKENLLTYKKISDLELTQIDGRVIRDEVNSAGPLAKSIIKYTFSRIFELPKSTTPIFFEDKFLNPNEKILKIRKFVIGDVIFRTGSTNQDMYFIENGAIKLLSKNNRVLAELSTGHCFGESAILREKKREISAVVTQDTILRIIDKNILFDEISKETPYVKLSLLLILRRLEFMNTLRMADDFENN